MLALFSSWVLFWLGVVLAALAVRVMFPVREK